MKELLRNVLKPYSAVVFIENKLLGAFLLALSFFDINVALGGIVAVIATVGFAKFLRFERSLHEGFYIYNSLLVGMGVGYLYQIAPSSIFLIGTLSIFTFALSFLLSRVFSTYAIPILSLPFAVVTMFLYLAALKYSGLLSGMLRHHTTVSPHLPSFLDAFFRSLGSIFFLPDPLVGALLFLLLLAFSRIVALSAVFSFYIGVTLHSFLLGSYTQALYDPFSFNYILVGIALFGVFLLPTAKNFLIMLVAIAVSVVLCDAIGVLFQYYAIPVFTLPFNLTVIVFIFLLSLIYYDGFNTMIRSTPEASLANYFDTVLRFGKTPLKIALPFSGTWEVYQAFDDTWTHKGQYRYAYDFVQTKAGKTFQNDGNFLEDYYCFAQSVLAPVNGYVVALRDDLADNPIGEVDRINNWGNYIVIKSDGGFFVEISHLMQYSISVRVGQYVQVGQIIAKCGNSGYSPQPHLHIQVQENALLGSATNKFLIERALFGDTLRFNLVLKKGDSITAYVPNQAVASRLRFVLEERFDYEVSINDRRVRSYSFFVAMNTAGEFYFQDDAGNKLFFFTAMDEFYFYRYEGKESYLRYFFLLAPRIAFFSSAYKFCDTIPLNVVVSKFKRNIAVLLSIFHPKSYRYDVCYEVKNDTISSRFGTISLARNQKGFHSLTFGTTRLERKI